MVSYIKGRTEILHLSGKEVFMKIYGPEEDSVSQFSVSHNKGLRGLYRPRCIVRVFTCKCVLTMG
jgi:hypothetical protein